RELCPALHHLAPAAASAPQCSCRAWHWAQIPDALPASPHKPPAFPAHRPAGHADDDSETPPAARPVRAATPDTPQKPDAGMLQSPHDSGTPCLAAENILGPPQQS